MQTDILKHLVSPDDTIRHALQQLDTTQPKLCIVADSEGTILRTVSDGDIRRGLLQGLTLDSPVDDLPGRAPVVAASDTRPDTLRDMMASHTVNAIVLVDEHGAPIALCAIADLEDMILLSSPHIGNQETHYVKKAFETNWVAPAGPNLIAFEENLAAKVGRTEAVAVSSGTAGLHLALHVLGLAPRKNIYVSDKTFAASLQPILYEGLTPVLIDAEPHSWNMSPDALERRLEKDKARGQLPGAIIVVHLYGQSADMGRIMPLADRYGIPVIEDAAESLGASYENRASGGHGLLSVYSFNGNKIITTSGGGAVVTDDAALAQDIRNLATQGRDPFDHYQHARVAFNYRMSNILAGIGLGQLEVLEDRVARRREIFETYQAHLSDIPGVTFQQDLPGGQGNRWLSAMLLDPDQIAIHPYVLMRRLRSRGIETRPSWKPMHMQPLCHGMDFEAHSETQDVAATLFLRALCLPSGSNMQDAQQRRTISEIRNILTRDTN